MTNILSDVASNGLPVSIHNLQPDIEIDPLNEHTWIVIHGLWSSPTGRIWDLGAAIYDNIKNDFPQAQILVIDWSEAASDPNFGIVES
ncbi:MAG: hypothetical protein IT555_21440, partial [Acetobacteraceae bacterium]|nr:hypothetical protein [Acetobacteraceae bacterium]